MSKIADSNMTRTKALPAAGATATTDSVNLQTGLAVGSMSNLEVHFELPDLASLADDKEVNVTLEDSADDSTFAALSGTGVLTATGAGGVGWSGDPVRFYLPPDCRQYIRASITVDASGGDSTGDDFTLKFKI